MSTNHSFPDRKVTLIAGAVGPIGGMERHCLELINGLHARGWHVTVIARTLSGVRSHRIQWVRVGGPSRPTWLATPWFVVAATLLQLRHARGSVVHRSGAATLWAVHLTTAHFCVRALPAHLNRASRKGILYRFNGRVNARVLQWAEALLVRRAGLVVAVSGGLAIDLARFYPDVRDQLVTIPNGVQLERFARNEPMRQAVRRQLGIAIDQPVAIFCGSEWGRKGLDLLLGAMRQAPGHHLVIVGRGEEDVYARLAADLGVRDRVHFVGQQREPEHFYSAADVFVLPSLYEGLSLAALEALAAGLPLIIAEVPGAEELVDDGVNGWRVPPSAAAIATRLNDLASDDALSARFSRNSLERASGLSWNRMVNEYEETYRGLVERGVGRTPWRPESRN